MLEARGLTRTFGGVVALDRLDLAVEPNEILGLIGPNGSGKTTFFNVATGIYGADAGHITFDGAEITGLRRAPFITPGCLALSSGHGFRYRCPYSTTS